MTDDQHGRRSRIGTAAALLALFDLLVLLATVVQLVTGR